MQEQDRTGRTFHDAFTNRSGGARVAVSRLEDCYTLVVDSGGDLTVLLQMSRADVRDLALRLLEASQTEVNGDAE